MPVLLYPQHLPVLFHIAPATGKIIERHLRRLDDVPRYERRTLGSPLLGSFHAAFPFHHRPTVVARLGQQREHTLEIHLPIARRTEPSRAFRPRLIAAVYADAAA